MAIFVVVNHGQRTGEGGCSCDGVVCWCICDCQLRLSDAVEIALYDDDKGLMTWLEPEVLLSTILAKWNEEDYRSGEQRRANVAGPCPTLFGGGGVLLTRMAAVLEGLTLCLCTCVLVWDQVVGVFCVSDVHFYRTNPSRQIWRTRQACVSCSERR